MILQLCHVGAILLVLIPGVSCYDYNIVGLVISSLVAFFLIIPIVIMVFMLVQWNDWYLKKKTKEGRIKLPRDEWYIFPRRSKRKTPTLVSTPKSDRKVFKVQNVYQPESTLSRDQPQVVMIPVPVPNQSASVNRFEEKTQTLQLGEEEEPYVVADILPDSQQQSPYRHQHVQDVVMTSRDDDQMIGGDRNSSYRVSQQPDSDGNTMYVSINQDSAPSSRYLSQTVPARTIEHRPYHVQLTSVHYAESSLSQKMNRSTKTSGVPRPTQTIASSSRQDGGERMQSGATGRQSPVDDNIAVYNFDSEDKVAPTEQAEDVVLF